MSAINISRAEILITILMHGITFHLSVPAMRLKTFYQTKTNTVFILKIPQGVAINEC